MMEAADSKDYLTSQFWGNTSHKAAVRFEPCLDPETIENVWITQVKDMPVDAQRFKMAIAESLKSTGLLFKLYTPVPSGFLWLQFDPLENGLWVNCYSVDSSLWHTKEHLRCLIKHMESLKSILKADKVLWFTTRPALYRKLGYGPSKRVLMEA